MFALKVPNSSNGPSCRIAFLIRSFRANLQSLGAQYSISFSIFINKHTQTSDISLALLADDKHLYSVTYTSHQFVLALERVDTTHTGYSKLAPVPGPPATDCLYYRRLSLMPAAYHTLLVYRRQTPYFVNSRMSTCTTLRK